jgi:transcriptional regulator with XRE-family HTH domain
MTTIEFEDARHIARMSLEDVSNYLNISKRTLQRYEKNGNAPKAIIECLLMIGGRCPEFSLRNDFSGWSFGNGFLHSPGGDKFTSGDVLAGKSALLEQNRLHRISIRDRKKSSMVVSAKIYQFPLRRRESDRKYN